LPSVASPGVIPPIDRDAALEILEPHLQRLGGCVWRAWDRWTSETLLPMQVAKRSRASLVYDYAADEARRTLGGIDGLIVTEDRGFVLVNVEDRLLVRFKKFDKRLRTSGIATRQKTLFAHQQLTIDGLGPMTQLVVGYLLDEFELAISRVAVTCSLGSRIEWVIEIPRDVGTVASLPPVTSQPVDPTVRSAQVAERAREESGEAES
jgi:hypothetical protein